MAKSKKITGYTGSATEISIPSSIAGGIVNNIKADAFANKGITKLVVNNSSAVAPAGAPWGAAGATIQYTDKTVTIYAISYSLTNVTGAASNPASIESGATANLSFTANKGFKLPDSITVTGASYTYDKATGTLTLSNATADITITIACTAIMYNIKTTLTNVTADASNPAEIQAVIGSATLKFTANKGFKLPDSITVTGASYTYNKATGNVVLSNPTGAVSVTVVGEVVKLPVGGRIFYVHNDNGATYKFWDASGNELTTQTVTGLATADKYAIVSGTPTADKFYVFNNKLVSSKTWGKFGTSCGMTSDGIGYGKTNTATMMGKSPDGTMWTWLRDTINGNNTGGHNDWFIASKAEQDKLRESGLVNWYSSNYIWSSVEDINTYAYYWNYASSGWDRNGKSRSGCAVAARAF